MGFDGANACSEPDYGLVLEAKSSNVRAQQAISLLRRLYACEVDALFARASAAASARISYDGPSSASVLDEITVTLLVRKSIKAGDKVSGRHGNKGVISRVAPAEDMPHLADGTPVDIVLNPLSVPSRMNIGQILEARLGLIGLALGAEFERVVDACQVANASSERELEGAKSKISSLFPSLDLRRASASRVLALARKLSRGVGFECPPFCHLSEACIKALCRRAGALDASGRLQLFDGVTGLPFDQQTAVGSIYVLKLNHLVDDKMYARATGPYSMVTQQPLKGKANKGGQRLGEMEVWALQSYGVSYMLKEALTAKCDDVAARHVMASSIAGCAPRVESS